MPDRHEIRTRDASGRWGGARQLTDMQATFVRELVRTGCSGAEAARRAGYGDPEARAHELRKNPRIQEAMAQLQRQELGELANHSLVVARGILTGEIEAPVKVRADTAFRILDRAGHGPAAVKGQEAGAQKSLDQMSVQELEEFIRRGRQAQEGADKPMLDHQPAPANAPNAPADPPESPENCESE